MHARTRTAAAAIAAAMLAIATWAPAGARTVAAPRAALTHAPLGAIATTPVADGGEVHLCAVEGTAAFPGHPSVDVWGFAESADGTDCATLSPQVPGPTLELTAGTTVSVTLHNELAEDTSIVFPGFEGVPDITGVAPGGSTTYTVVADRPGTFVYEAGINQARQVGMGMAGAVVVRPAGGPGTAYDDPATAFDREYLMVLAEVDLGQHSDPFGFDLLTYRPTLFTINGAVYEDGVTDPLEVAAGERVLIRYVNVGFEHHAMTVLNARQRVIGQGGYPVLAYSVANETAPAGMTMDTIVEIPAGATAGMRFPVYERNLRVTNGAAYPGGMLRFLEVA